MEFSPDQPQRLPTFHCAPPARELAGEGKTGPASPPDWSRGRPLLLLALGPRLLQGNFSPPSLGSTEYQGSAPGVPSAPTRAAPPLQNPGVNNGLQKCVARSRTEGHCANPVHKGDCLFFFFPYDAKRCFRHLFHSNPRPPPRNRDHPPCAAQLPVLSPQPSREGELERSSRLCCSHIITLISSGTVGLWWGGREETAGPARNERTGKRVVEGNERETAGPG